MGVAFVNWLRNLQANVIATASFISMLTCKYENKGLVHGTESRKTIVHEWWWFNEVVANQKFYTGFCSRTGLLGRCV